MTSGDPKIAKIQAHFQELSSLATSLNTASDELTSDVGVLDEALKKLNIGLTTWVTFRTWDVQPPEYDYDQIGYAKVNGTWGIALRHVWGNEACDEEAQDGPWLFNDAPRDVRLHGVDKIPDVIEALAKITSHTTKKVQEKAKEVRELAAAINQVANPPKAVKGFRDLPVMKLSDLAKINPEGKGHA